MDYDNFYNALSYDEQLIGDKLGLVNQSRASKPSRSRSPFNEQLEKALQVKSEKVQESVRENFTGSVGGNVAAPAAQVPVSPVPSLMSIGLDDKFMFMLLIVLAVVCFVQYVHQQQMCSIMNEMMLCMMKNAPVAK